MQRVRAQIGCESKLAEAYTGKKVTVAVLDTGIVSHPDFSGRIVAFRDFLSLIHI